MPWKGTEAPMDDDKIEKLFEQLSAAVMNRGLSDCPPKYLGGSRSDVQPMTNPKTEAPKDESLTIAQLIAQLVARQLVAEYNRSFLDDLPRRHQEAALGNADDPEAIKWVESLGSCVAPQDDEGD